MYYTVSQKWPTLQSSISSARLSLLQRNSYIILLIHVATKLLLNACIISHIATWEHIYNSLLRRYSIIGSGSGFTMNANPKWIRLTFDTPKVIRFAKWIWTDIHCESWSGSDNRIAPKKLHSVPLTNVRGREKNWLSKHNWRRRDDEDDSMQPASRQLLPLNPAHLFPWQPGVAGARQWLPVTGHAKQQQQQQFIA